MIPNIELSNGVSIPQLGFGTYLVKPEETATVVGRAIEVGYRHVDTAQGYANEAGVGAAVAASGVAREEFFLTSKLNNDKHRRADVRSSFEETLAALQTDYLDLFLIHWPLPTRYDGDFVSTWRALTELVSDGRLRAAGVSNFQPSHLQRIFEATGVAPAVNQVEAHPFFPNDAVRGFCARHGIAVEAWGPLGQGAVLADPVVAGIAARHGRTSAQVILRWHLQRGDIVFPKSVNVDRMRQNLDVFDFELGADDLAAIAGLDQGSAGRVGPHPDTFDMV